MAKLGERFVYIFFQVNSERLRVATNSIDGTNNGDIGTRHHFDQWGYDRFFKAKHSGNTHRPTSQQQETGDDGNAQLLVSCPMSEFLLELPYYTRCSALLPDKCGYLVIYI
jgi:hypothetical protein